MVNVVLKLDNKDTIVNSIFVVQVSILVTLNTFSSSSIVISAVFSFPILSVWLSIVRLFTWKKKRGFINRNEINPLVPNAPFLYSLKTENRG